MRVAFRPKIRHLVCLSTFLLICSVLLLVPVPPLAGQQAAAGSSADGSDSGSGSSVLSNSAAGSGFSAGELQVFAPFVSKIRMAVRDPEIKLTWTDIPDYSNIYEIYRHTEEITSDNFSDAEYAGFANQGDQQFIDLPLVAGNYFYAVLASDAQGELYNIFIPLRNASITGIRVAQLPERQLGLDAIAALAAQRAAAQAGAAGESAEIAAANELGTIVSDSINEQLSEEQPTEQPAEEQPAAAGLPNIVVEARTDLQTITITLATLPAGSRWAVYRNTVPIVGSQSLETAVLVAAVETDGNELRDYVVPGIPWYYAAVNADTLAATSASLVPGTNTIIEPVTLPLGSIAVPRTALGNLDAREPGLPLLNPNLTQFRPSYSTSLPAQNAASAEARRALDSIRFGLQPESSRGAALADVLAGDLEPDAISAPAEALILASVLRGDFAAGNWEQAILLFENVLTLPLEQDRRERAEYYLAQARYFAGDLQQAFMTFLLLQNSMSDRAAPWMDRILRDLGQES